MLNRKLLCCLTACITLSACQPNKPQPEHFLDAATKPATDIYQDYLNRDVRDDIFYFVLPDRFENGDKSNDFGSAEQALSFGGFNPESKAYYHGGDLKGLAQKLDYLADLGITAIWMTPILRNRAVQGDSSAYHGYWIIDFTQIDPHLGSNDDLKALIASAHAKGIKVFFDIITNHTADIIRYRECHDEQGRHLNKNSFECQYKSSEQITAGDTYTPFIPDGQSHVKVPDWLNDTQYYNNQGDSFWQGESAVYGDFSGLDDLDTRQPDVVNGFIDIYKNIIREFKPDGFRIDTVKHVDLSFWQQFSPAIMEYAHQQGIPNFHMFGEVYDFNPAFLSRFTTHGKLPAVLDFAFQSEVDSVFVNQASPTKLSELFAEDDYYSDADSEADKLLTFLGNHDMGRIGLFLNQHQPQASEAEKARRSILAHAFMYFARGIPVVYYGDEQGFTGDGNDQDAREDMMPSLVASYNDNNLLGTDATTADNNFDQSHPIYLALAEFANIYKSNIALRRGIQIERLVDEATGVYAFSRVDPKEQTEYLIVFNTDNDSHTASIETLSSNYALLYEYSAEKSKLSQTQDLLEIDIAGLSFAIYKAGHSLTPVVLPDISIKQAQIDNKDPERYSIEYQLDANDQFKQAGLIKVTTEYLTDSGAFKLISEDYTAPYRAKLVLQDWLKSQKKIRVTLDNLNAQSKVFEFDLSSK